MTARQLLIKVNVRAVASALENVRLELFRKRLNLPVYVGGTWGKNHRFGTLLSGIYSQSEVPEIIEKVMLWFKQNAYFKERLGSAIDRLGIETLENAIKTNELLDKKEEILSAPILER